MAVPLIVLYFGGVLMCMYMPRRVVTDEPGATLIPSRRFGPAGLGFLAAFSRGANRV